MTFSGLLTSTSSFFSWVTGISSGSTYILTRWFFLRALGIIYLIAFLSLWVQVKGLIGSNGILPIQGLLDLIRQQLPGMERIRIFPTLFWISASDAALHVVCGLGVLFSVLLILGIAPLPSLIVLWVLYLSLTVAGQDFLSFQWDILLLEVGFLAIFFAPLALTGGLAHETMVSPLVLFLLWFLLFRLTFESGVVKLNVGDPTWRNFTALDYHYWSQPLPTWTAWYLQQLPHWFHVLSMGFMYIAELAAPFLIFWGRTPRIVGCGLMVLLQVLIGLTGNYNFFNLLTIALCLLLLDDAFLRSVLPVGFAAWLGGAAAVTVPIPTGWSVVAIFVAALVLLVGGKQLLETAFPWFPMPHMLDRLERALHPFRSVNPYGLFRVMTVKRPEIIVEGSDDGATWFPYEFKWKPGDLTVRPKFVEPHQPRLDWQMWFAALGRHDSEPWFQNFLVRLLQGSPDVLALIRKNPFLDHPPKFIRAVLYEYEFTDLTTKRREGTWWRRRLRGLYSPVLSLSRES
jgi:hypothetical protein